MNARLTLAVVAIGTAAILPARAYEVIDPAALVPRTDTKEKTIKLVPIQSGTKDQTNGIKCAVTTGQRASVADPSKKADAGQGQATALAYGPDLPAGWQPVTTGSTQNQEIATGNFGRNQALATAGDVAGRLSASEGTVPATATVYRQQGTAIGRAATIQGAWDQNSGIRVQNALTWNQSTNALNLFVQALTLANLMRANDLSRAATAIGGSLGAAMAGAAGTGITCGPGQIVNPYTGFPGLPGCLDAQSPNTSSQAAEALAVFQAAARAAAMAQ